MPKSAGSREEEAPPSQRWPLFAKLASQFPPGEFLRYVLLGGFNTAFGYTTFAIINYILHKRNVPVSYLFASGLSGIINVTVAFVGYKFFVFRTRGNYLREWLKAMTVYWSGFLPTLLLLPLLVRLFNVILPQTIYAFHHMLVRKELAPYVANAFLMIFGIVYTFVGHKKFTFRQKAHAPN